MERQVCIWRVSDLSYRVRITDCYWPAVRSKLLTLDSYWSEICAGLEPVYRLPVPGREESLSLCRAAMKALDVPLRGTRRPVAWMSSDGSTLRMAGTVAALGLGNRSRRQLACGFGTEGSGYIGYVDHYESSDQKNLHPLSKR